MTGPLAQQFAQVREGLGDGCAFACGCEDPGNPQRCIHAERFAALSVIERHVQDMARREEQLAHALSWYDDHKSLTGNYDGEMWGDLRDVEYEYERDSAALSAREKGEE